MWRRRTRQLHMNEAVKRVLLIEGDVNLSGLLQAHLGAHGYAVEHTSNGCHGLALAERGGWDAIVLDLMLPGIHGQEICRRARSPTRYTPIIVTRASSNDNSSEEQHILDLEMGADDDLTKPFSAPELLARLRALLHRVEAIAKRMQSDECTVEAGGLHVNRLTRQAKLNGQALALTPREFDLLHYFAGHPERVVSRIELLNHVWGTRHDGYQHTVNTHINRLRSKIEVDPRHPNRIVTVWGQGYKFALPAGAANHRG
jgi:two-component system, OmpR family, response regulator